MKKEWLLATGVAMVTLVVAIGLIRWFAPQLLGIPLDLQTVRISREIPPFFENVFRKEDIEGLDFALKDPYTNVRGRPLFGDLFGLGPHDLLGFRNRYIPNIADIVVIGDSQTYGLNAELANNWPSEVEWMLGDKKPVTYNMAVGGWCAIQYLGMFRYAAVFQPRVIVVAFYTGNDPDESVTLAYSAERWMPLRPDPHLNLSDRPPFPGFPTPPSEQWQAHFKGGTTITFTPSLRLVSNDTSYATVRAGYRIMEKTAQLMSKSASEANIRLVLTIIPTKELVYAERIRREGISANAEYTKLVRLERENIVGLAQLFKSLPNTEYVNMIEPLQHAAVANVQLYPSEQNGHPNPAGYRVIAATLAPVIGRYLPQSPQGLVGVSRDSNTFIPFLVTTDGLWKFGTEEIAIKNGWKFEEARIVAARDIAALPKLGIIDVVDPKRFGPRAIHGK